MKDTFIQNELKSDDSSRICGCYGPGASRRFFLVRASCALAAALVSSGLFQDGDTALAFATMEPLSQQGTERSYPMPAGDGVTIDEDNEVILVRQANRLYAFALSCPHENTALRWRQQDLRFQCPRHESKYQPDGVFIAGRATRNMDRFAMRRDGQKVIVDLSKLYRSDQQKTEWDAAVLIAP